MPKKSIESFASLRQAGPDIAIDEAHDPSIPSRDIYASGQLAADIVMTGAKRALTIDQYNLLRYEYILAFVDERMGMLQKLLDEAVGDEP